MDWLLLECGVGDAAFNMAMDEALLLSMRRLRGPVLRFYSWTEKAASFGYFQKYSDAEKLTHLRPLVRRPTGGGFVPHDADWTYSMVFPASHVWYALRATESYRKIHEWLQAAFSDVAVKTELAPAARRAGTGQCFAGYEKSDLLWQGIKIAGAAQRRTRDGLLIQGSVQPGLLIVNRSDWQKAMSTVAAQFIGGQEESFRPDDPTLRTLADELARDKYSVSRYNRKR